MRQDVLEPAELAGQRRIDRAAVEEVDPARLRADGRVLRGDADRRHHHHGQRRLVVLADDQDVAAALRAEDDRGGVLDRDRVAQPGRVGLGGLGPFGRLEQVVQAAGSCCTSAGRLPSKTIGGGLWMLRSRHISWIRSRYFSRRSSESQTTWKRLFPSNMPLASL